MKKSIFTLGLMSAILALTSCVKDNTDTAIDLGQKQITQTVTLGEQTRSSYKPGEGVTIDKNESMTVYYMANNDEDLATYVFAGKLSAANDGNNNFTFSHEAIEGATAYDYYFMMPDNSTNNMNGGKVASTHRLGQVQRPSATSFDPSFDYIVGKPVTIAADNMGTATVIDYKRLVAPLCITFNDSEGLLSGQKIHSVNVVTNAAASQTSSLQGLFYVNYSDIFADCKISSWDKTSISNGMTASYDEGIEQDGSWESWFMVRDVTIPAGDMTITIVGDKNTIKRTFAMGEFTTVMDKINRLSINLSSSNCTITKSFTVDFSATTKLPASVTTSEGQTLAFSATTCQISTNATNGNSLQINKGGSFTLPAPAQGLKYKSITLTEQNTNGTKDYIVAAYSGENEISSGNFNYYNEALRNNGGVLKLDIAEEYGADAITIKRTDSEANNYCRIIRLTVEYEGEATEPEPEPATNSYYTAWQNGEDITIGKAAEDTFVVNKTNYPEASLITADMDGTTIHNILLKGGLIFMESDCDILMHSTDASADIVSKHMKFNKDVETIIIGVDPTSQPYIEVEGQYYANGTLLALKNISFKANGTYGIVNANECCEDDCKLYIEDCTYAYTQNGIAENNPTMARCYSHIYILNSVIHAEIGSKNSYGTYKLNVKTDASGYAKDFTRMKAIKYINSIFYANSDYQHYLIDAGSKAADKYDTDTSNLAIEIKNCTLYGLHQSNIMARAYKLSSVYFGYNVGYYENSDDKNTYVMGDYAKTCTNLLMEYNHLTTTSDAGGNGWKVINQGNVSTYKDTTSVVKSKDVDGTYFPFASDYSVTDGYFPINYSIVATGCGASYDTKLWVNAE